jgi:Txe/YoeB family toxin of Txe-Axe toxin-antitoxin module
MQTDDQMVKMISLLLQAAEIDPWAIMTPEQVQKLVKFLQEPIPANTGGQTQ